MQARQPERGDSYAGPCVVTVRIGAWRGFAHHSPGWWPRAFPPPTRSVVERVDQGLRKLLVT
jgi:hypothetical protein